MSKYTALFLLCLVFCFNSCASKELAINSIDSEGSKEEPPLKINGISKEEAIALANKEASKDYKSLEQFQVVPCEQVAFWRIIYDGGGPEYVIDKISGTIIRRQKLPQSLADDQSEEGLRQNKAVSQQEAVAIAKKDAKESYGSKVDIGQFVVITCEQMKVWRVIFDFKLEPGQSLQNLPNGSFPKYVIDKRTGKIIYKELN